MDIFSMPRPEYPPGGRGRLEDFVFELESDFLVAAALAASVAALRRRIMRNVATHTTITTPTAAPIMPPNWAVESPFEEGSEARTFATAVAEGADFVIEGKGAVVVAGACVDVSVYAV
jgi:hypothetical protein